MPFPQRQFTVNVFHHDDGAVDDDAEIDGSDRKQIGGHVVGMQDDEGKQKRQRNGQRDDDCGADADQEKDQHNQDQHHAAQQVVFDRIRGEID